MVFSNQADHCVNIFRIGLLKEVTDSGFAISILVIGLSEVLDSLIWVELGVWEREPVWHITNASAFHVTEDLFKLSLGESIRIVGVHGDQLIG